MSGTEEAAWLVARSDSESSARLGFGTMTYTDDRLSGTEGSGEPGASASNPPPEPPDPAPDTDSGELLTQNDTAALDHFHEDALRQAGCGLSQTRVMLASGLAVAGAALELSAIPFILPSAEIELCILPHEKNWLVLISLVGASLGSAWWGAVCARLGARRALLSALAVNAVFAPVAAFMPTYGTFMMARFCSAIGSGGIIPTTFTYVSEVTPREWRYKALALLLAAMGVGAVTSSALAQTTLPLTGVLTLKENKEHFSAWHRYLLLCTLPILASLVALIWTPESPRFLLEVGREVDAMTVYQNIHSGNQIRICGKANVAAANSRAPSYHLGELSLPGKRRAPIGRHCKHSVEMYGLAIVQLFSNTYRRSTLCLGGILLFSVVMQFYLSSYVSGHVADTEMALFESSKVVIKNETLHSAHYNRTLENVHYINDTFVNCTFSDMLFSHVTFKNCSFFEVAFLNVKTSYSVFEGCLFVNSTIIDTDLEVGRQLISSTLNSTVILGMQAGCGAMADLTSTLEHTAREQQYVAHATLVATVLALFPPKLRPTVVLCGLCLLLSPSLYFVKSETPLYVMEAVYRVILALIFFTVSCNIVDNYPSSSRSIAHGSLLTVAYSGGAIVMGVAPGGATLSCILCGLFSAGATVLAVRGR